MIKKKMIKKEKMMRKVKKEKMMIKAKEKEKEKDKNILINEHIKKES